MNLLKNLWLSFIERGKNFVDIEGPDGGYLMDIVDSLALLIFIIGFFLIMAGCREKGTKITSFTFIAYIVIKACVAYV